MRGQLQVTPGQLPVPTFVPVTVEPGTIPTLIYAESSISILKLLELGEAVSLIVPRCHQLRWCNWRAVTSSSKR